MRTPADNVVATGCKSNNRDCRMQAIIWRSSTSARATKSATIRRTLASWPWNT